MRAPTHTAAFTFCPSTFARVRAWAAIVTDTASDWFQVAAASFRR